MASPSELSIDEIRNFIQSRGGKVTNYELVKHFKRFLTDPQQKETARETFKKYVNILGSIKNENGEKYIVLKKKKTQEPSVNKPDDSLTFSPSTSFQEVPEQREPPPYIPPPSVLQPIQNIQLQDVVKPDYQRKASLPQSPTEPDSDEVVYRHSIKQQVNKHPHSYTQDYVSKPSEFGIQYQDAQQSDIVVSHQMINVPEKQSSVAVRKQSLESSMSVSPQNKKPFHHSVSTSDIQNKSDNITSNKHNKSLEDVLPQEDTSMKKTHSTPEIAPLGIVTKQKKRLERAPIPDEPDSTTSSQEISPNNNRESSRSLNLDCEPVSVKERMERFNKFAVDGDHNRRSSLKKFKVDYAHIVIPGVRPIGRSYFLMASSGNFQGVINLLRDEPDLINSVDPITTILHWGAKYNSPEIIKFGFSKVPTFLNRPSNGGYTPLHVARIFNNQEVFDQLLHVYGANADLRDFAGRKPRSYGSAELPGPGILGMPIKKQPDQKFLRMGSLNIRVKKTTTAVTNFLGVGTSQKTKNSQSLKAGALTSWGSADNIKDDKVKMPPPQSAVVRRKTAKKHHESFSLISRSTPTTPKQPRSSTITSDENISPSPSTSTLQDSDSDTACGFDANWQDKKLSN